MIEANITKKHQFQIFATLHNYITMLIFTCVFVGGLFLWIAARRVEVHPSINVRKYIERNFNIPTEIKETHLFPLQEVFTTESSPSTNNFRNKNHLLLASKKQTSGGNIICYHSLY